MGVLLATIDGSIVNVALPTLVDDLSTTFPIIQWVSLGYLLTLAALTLSVGRLGDIVGKKRIYTIGFVAFTIASTLCGLAPNVGALIGFRVLQALGAVMILALGPAILVEAFPPNERGKALGLIGTAVSVGIITGPVVGGLLISEFGWRAIFFVNIPVGIVGTWLVLRSVPDTKPIGRQVFDVRGAGLLSVGLLSLSLALTVGQEAGFSSGPILALFVLALVAGATFVRVELSHPSPMVQLRLFKSPELAVSVAAGFLTFVAMSGTFFLLPFYLEGVLGFPINRVGLLLGAAPLLLGVVAPASGSLSDRIGIRPLTIAGLVTMTLVFFGFLTLGTNTSIPHYLALAAPLGLGMGLFQSPNNSAIMGAVPPEYAGVGGGLLTITRLFGSITGIAVIGSIWATRVAAAGGGSNAPAAAAEFQVAGLHDASLVMAIVIAIATMLAVVGLARVKPRSSYG